VIRGASEAVQLQSEEDCRLKRCWSESDLLTLRAAMASYMDAQEAEARPKRRGRRRREEEEEELSRRERERAHRQKRLQRRREEEERRVEGEYVEVSSEEEHELCFREPQQLVDSFTELEEKNLFLIHSSQETEQQLDELRHLYENSKKEMGAKVKHLKDTVKAQEARIAQEQQRFEDLRRRHDEKADTRVQDRKVSDLKESVRQLYARCCPHSSADHDRGPLQMLAEIEAEVEKLITGLEEYSQLGPGGADLITELEKGKEKARRDRLREVSMREKEAKDERRLKASLERSQAPVFRKAGKQVMYRSPPLRTEQKVVEDNTDQEAMEDERLISKMKRYDRPEAVKGQDGTADAAELFTVDTKGSLEGISATSRKELARAKLFPPKGPDLGLSAAEEAKVARAEGALGASRKRPRGSSEPEVFDLWAAPDPATAAKQKARAEEEAAMTVIRRKGLPAP